MPTSELMTMRRLSTNEINLGSRWRPASFLIPDWQTGKVRGRREDIQSLKIGIFRGLTFWLALSLWLVPAHAGAQQREKVRVALGSISVNTSVIPVGQQAGLFSKHGIDLEPIYMGGGMNSLAAVTSNSVQFLAAGSTATRCSATSTRCAAPTCPWPPASRSG